MVAVTVPSTINFDENRDELIEDALRLAGVLDIERTPSASMSASADRTLDAYLKHLMSRGLQLWRKTEGVLFLDPGEESYSVGSDGDEACRVSDLVSTTLTTAAASSDTALTVGSTAGMAVSDRIGVELTAGTRFWTTIATIPGATSLTLTTGLSGAASADATIVTYTTKIERPVRILSARRRDSSGVETPITLISYEEYQDQPNKSTESAVVMAHYSPQMDNGTLFVWPTTDDVRDQFRFTFERVIADVDTGTDELDFPQEWLEALKYGLALRLAHKYGKLERIQYLKPEAEQKERELLNFDVEDTSVFFSPDRR